jgi:hypothetical protein
MQLYRPKVEGSGLGNHPKYRSGTQLAHPATANENWTVISRLLTMGSESHLSSRARWSLDQMGADAPTSVDAKFSRIFFE